MLPNTKIAEFIERLMNTNFQGKHLFFNFDLEIELFSQAKICKQEYDVMVETRAERQILRYISVIIHSNLLFHYIISDLVRNKPILTLSLQNNQMEVIESYAKGSSLCSMRAAGGLGTYDFSKKSKCNVYQSRYRTESQEFIWEEEVCPDDLKISLIKIIGQL